MLTHIMKRFLAVSLMLASSWLHADLVVLQYHHIDDSTPPSTSTTTSLFEAQLSLIEKLELKVVPLDTATHDALAGRSEHSKQVAITFDDAYSSVLTTAAPRLDRKELPYTIFVNTQTIGEKGYLTWQQLEELSQKSWVLIANHSADHTHLARRPDESQSEWRKRVLFSIDTAQATLKERLGIESTLFAYPYGEFDSALEELVTERGWIGYGQQSGAIGAFSAATRLPRFPMANTYGQLNSLKNKLLSKALPIDASKLPDGIVSSNPPQLVMSLPKELTASQLNCFASGQGRIPVTATEGNNISVVAPKTFNSRRFRYNCTYPAGDGRFYWFSQPWLDLSKPED